MAQNIPLLGMTHMLTVSITAAVTVWGYTQGQECDLSIPKGSMI